MEEFWEEMRRREREEEEGEARPQKSKMWRVRGKQRAGGTGAATLPLHPLPIPYASGQVTRPTRIDDVTPYGLQLFVRTKPHEGHT